jgi:hypothetical protein
MIWINCARKRTHPSAVARGRAQRRPRALGFHLRRLDGSEIKQERPRVLTRETKRRHIRMADREPFAQSLHERIKIHATIEQAKGRGTNVRTLASPANGMTLRAHAFCQSTAALLERTLRRAKGGLRASRPRWELPFSDEKRLPQRSLIRLRALRRRSKRNGGFAVETRKGVELRALLVRLAAQHCNAAKRAMSKRRPRVSRH